MHAQNMYAVQGRLYRPANRTMNPVPGSLFPRQRSYKALAGKPHKDRHAKAVKQG